MIDSTQDDICRYYGDTRSVNSLTRVATRNPAQTAVRAQAVAAQWELRKLAKGKPQRARDAAMMAIMQIKNIARGLAAPSVYAALAENIERLRSQ